MSLWSRIANVLSPGRLNDEIDEELESHIEEAIARGRDPEEVRRAFGSRLRHRDYSRDARLITWLDAIRADFVFGWRQLRKNQVTSAAALVSLALAIGACSTAFRLIDALLLRPLPIADPQRLHVLVRSGIGPDGRQRIGEGTEYPLFRRWRSAVKDEAELIAVSFTSRVDLTYGSDDAMEKAYRQYVSGWMFADFGLRPAVGRLLTEADDATPKSHPHAVLAHHYWTSRFGGDPNVVGRTFRQGDDVFRIVGVVERGFTGTEPGTMTDIFIPTMMHEGVTRSDWSWFRTLVHVRPDAPIEPLRAQLAAVFRVFQEERVRGFVHMNAAQRRNVLRQDLVLEPAAAGVSGMQRDNRQALLTLGCLVVLVLVIACANIANLMTAQAAARAREMALRVSIGAGRGRLVQLVLVESACLALLATLLGTLFAWWSAPWVVGMISTPDNLARLALPTDWRVLTFSAVLAVAVTGLFGLLPALHASSVRPIHALKGAQLRSRRRMMHVLVATQVAFCVPLLFLAGLFVATFERLASQPVGFSTDRLVTVETVSKPPQPIVAWEQLAAHLRAVAGVEKVAMSAWPLMSTNSWNGFVRVGGAPPSDTLAYFLRVSPKWRDIMQIRLIAGRDLRPADVSPGPALVNETFARLYFGEASPLGRTFEKPETGDPGQRFEVVGVVSDARYRNMREPSPPTAYVPLLSRSPDGELVSRANGSLVVRTANADPLSLAPVLRQQVRRAHSDFRVSNVITQQALVDQHTIRERLLATLGLFFAGVALVLVAVGLYGVLHYTVVQRRREIGIRLALGANTLHVARRVTLDVFGMVVAGALVGIALGLAAQRQVTALFYEVNASDPTMLAIPWLMISVAALLAAVPPVIRATQIDPAEMLRSD